MIDIHKLISDIADCRVVCSRVDLIELHLPKLLSVSSGNRAIAWQLASKSISETVKVRPDLANSFWNRIKSEADQDLGNMAALCLAEAGWPEVLQSIQAQNNIEQLNFKRNGINEDPVGEDSLEQKEELSAAIKKAENSKIKAEISIPESIAESMFDLFDSILSTII
jgi:hypothetical protein